MDPPTVGVVVAAAAALLTAVIAKLRCVLRTGDDHSCDAGCAFSDQALFPRRGAEESESDGDVHAKRQ